jgi:hypothetical protein
MDREYDVFEVCPDHSLKWRVRVLGKQATLAALEALTNETVNECFAMDIRTQEIIGSVNEGRAQARILDEDDTAN